MTTPNLADRMLDIYEAGRHAARTARVGQHLNPYAGNTAEHHCWAHGWRNQMLFEIDDAIEAMARGRPNCGDRVADDIARNLAEAWPAEGGAV